MAANCWISGKNRRAEKTGRAGIGGSASRTGRDVGRVGWMEVGRKIVYFSGVRRYSRYLIFSNILVFLYRSYSVPILFV